MWILIMATQPPPAREQHMRAPGLTLYIAEPIRQHKRRNSADRVDQPAHSGGGFRIPLTSSRYTDRNTASY